MLRQPSFLIVFGTRPEAIKLAPLARELRARGRRVHLVATGQHPALAGAMLHEVGLVADADLGIHRPGQAPADMLAAVLTGLPPLLDALRPTVVIVQGDTVSALGGALAAAYAQVPVAHVEAGLRTGNRGSPFPEEHQRMLIGRIAALHFAPTPAAARSLLGEGVAPAAVHVTGNTGIDALLSTEDRLNGNPALLTALALRHAALIEPGPPLIVATIHRRENVGARLPAISAAFAQLAGSGAARFAIPLHPNPRVSDHFTQHLGAVPGVHLLPALDHAELIWLLQRSHLIVTDSGGLMEEAPALGVRALIARTHSERPEAVACGAARLVGHRTHAIVDAVRAALAEPPIARMFPFGDGQAAARIAGHFDDWLNAPAPARALQTA